ncbi:MAG: glycosyltransferase family 4 protein [Chloroflexota bacterium]
MPAEPRRELLTTWYFPGRESWEARCEMLDRSAISRRALLARLLRGARGRRALILDGSVGPGDLYSDLLAGIAIRRRPGGGRTPIVIGECQWKLGGSRLDRMATRLGLRALDGPRIAYCVLTRWERERFAATWGVAPERVFVTPYCHTLSDADLAAPTSTEGGVFAGGNSLRDYAPLVAAAAELDEPVTLATKLLDGPLPANVTAGPVPYERFFELLRNARVVVVPLAGREDRTAGQQTYLNAMALGKATIVTDSPGVREYVEDGRTGLVVPPGDAEALREALRWVLDPENADAVERMRAAAKQTARTTFSPERYAQSLLDVADAIS